jgi:hypothetical protein
MNRRNEMTRLTKLFALSLVLGFCSTTLVSADPLAVIGNNMTQNRIGTSTATQVLSNIFNSTVANGSAGNTFTVAEAKTDGGFATFIGNNVLQQEIGQTHANQSASNIIGSSVANNAAGNAITFSGQ